MVTEVEVIKYFVKIIASDDISVVDKFWDGPWNQGNGTYMALTNNSVVNVVTRNKKISVAWKTFKLACIITIKEGYSPISSNQTDTVGWVRKTQPVPHIRNISKTSEKWYHVIPKIFRRNVF